MDGADPTAERQPLGGGDGCLAPLCRVERVTPVQRGLGMGKRAGLQTEYSSRR